MENVIAWLARKLGFQVVYVCEWGVYEHRYNYLDRQMQRPIHRDMSTAPPWAKRRIVRSLDEFDEWDDAAVSDLIRAAKE